MPSILRRGGGTPAKNAQKKTSDIRTLSGCEGAVGVIGRSILALAGRQQNSRLVTPADRRLRITKWPSFRKEPVLTSKPGLVPHTASVARCNLTKAAFPVRPKQCHLAYGRSTVAGKLANFVAGGAGLSGHAPGARTVSASLGIDRHRPCENLYHGDKGRAPARCVSVPTKHWTGPRFDLKRAIAISTHQRRETYGQPHSRSNVDRGACKPWAELWGRNAR